MSTKRMFSLLVAALCLLYPGAFARSSFSTAQLDAFMTRMMKAYDVPGVGLAIVENGEISYVHGYGVRNVKTGSPVLPETQFAVGSVTKSFTALGIMVLVNEGLVDLDAPVVTYLPEFKLADPVSTQTVTVRNLLTQTTGLTRTDASTFDPTITTKDIIAAAATTPLVGKPGEQFVYSNVNAILAGAIIERVTGESWKTFTRARILTPLEMNTATLSIAELKKQRNVAQPHSLNVLEGVQPTDFLTLGADTPAGAVNANAAEMARYAQFQLENGAPLLSQVELSEMHQGQIAAPGFDVPSMIAAQARQVASKPSTTPPSLVTNEQYGFFWGIDHFLGHKLVQHGGNTTGFTANVTLLPEQRSGVVILANANAANYFMEAVRLHVAELLLGRKSPDVNATLQTQLKVLHQDNASVRADMRAARSYQPKQGELAPFAGTYKSLGSSKPTTVKVIGGRKLELETGYQSVRFTAELLPLGKGRFMGAAEPLTGVVVKFDQGAKERTIELETIPGPVPLAVKRTND